jgi:probable phosphoglycerate mutase
MIGQREIFLIRHAQTEFNKEGIVQGSKIDSDINETGKWQSKKLYEFYKEQSFDLAFVSELKRTEQTLFPFLEKGLEFKKMKELNEINWGIHEGAKAKHKAKKDFTKLINQWKSGNLNAKLTGGESGLELYSRVQSFWKTLQKEKGNRFLICSHGRTLRALLSYYLFENLMHMESFQQMNTSVYVLRMEKDEKKIILSNDLSHLE